MLIVPGLLTPAECAAVVAEVESQHALNSQAERAEASAAAFQRYLVPELSDETQRLFDRVLRERLLPFVSAQMPDVEELIWYVGCAAQSCCSSSSESLHFPSRVPRKAHWGCTGRASRDTSMLQEPAVALLQDGQTALSDLRYKFSSQVCAASLLVGQCARVGQCAPTGSRLSVELLAVCSGAGRQPLH